MHYSLIYFSFLSLCCLSHQASAPSSSSGCPASRACRIFGTATALSRLRPTALEDRCIRCICQAPTAEADRLRPSPGVVPGSERRR